MIKYHPYSEAWRRFRHKHWASAFVFPTTASIITYHHAPTKQASRLPLLFPTPSLHTSLLLFHMKRVAPSFPPVQFSVYSLSLNHHKAFDHMHRQRGHLVLIFQVCPTSFTTISVLFVHMKNCDCLGFNTIPHYCLCLFSIYNVCDFDNLCLCLISLYLLITVVIHAPSVQHTYLSASKCSHSHKNSCSPADWAAL